MSGNIMSENIIKISNKGGHMLGSGDYIGVRGDM